MTFLNKISIVALLCLTSNTVWSEPVNFCKVKKVYDDDFKVPAKMVFEDCSGVALLWYARDLIKAACWQGATDLLEGKCETHKDDYKDAAAENSGTGVQEEKSN